MVILLFEAPAFPARRTQGIKQVTLIKQRLLIKDAWILAPDKNDRRDVALIIYDQRLVTTRASVKWATLYVGLYYICHKKQKCWQTALSLTLRMDVAETNLISKN
jgi:hypothetical protein